jgi:hypothetical protein
MATKKIVAVMSKAEAYTTDQFGDDLDAKTAASLKMDHLMVDGLLTCQLSSDFFIMCSIFQKKFYPQCPESLGLKKVMASHAFRIGGYDYAKTWGSEWVYIKNMTGAPLTVNIVGGKGIEMPEDSVLALRFGGKKGYELFLPGAIDSAKLREVD